MVDFLKLKLIVIYFNQLLLLNISNHVFTAAFPVNFHLSPFVLFLFHVFPPLLSPSSLSLFPFLNACTCLVPFFKDSTFPIL